MLLLCWMSFGFATSDRCINCHKVITTPAHQKEHKILDSCTNCHQKSTSRIKEYKQDCFLCHDRNKLIHTPQQAHKALSTCISCHKPKESLLEIYDRTPSLLDILNQK